MGLGLKLAECTGCRLCQLACSAVHERVFNPQAARLMITHEYSDEGLHIASKHCIFCKKCEEACPVGAISNNGRWMIVDFGICIGCGDCVRSCPEKVIFLNEKRKSIICDLCGGRPKCVEWCPKAVIKLVEKVAT